MRDALAFINKANTSSKKCYSLQNRQVWLSKNVTICHYLPLFATTSAVWAIWRLLIFVIPLLRGISVNGKSMNHTG